MRILIFYFDYCLVSLSGKRQVATSSPAATGFFSHSSQAQQSIPGNQNSSADPSA
jgi:hypothetical protein